MPLSWQYPTAVAQNGGEKQTCKFWLIAVIRPEWSVAERERSVVRAEGEKVGVGERFSLGWAFCLNY